MNIDELMVYEKMRYDCFRFLSACFCQPRKDVFREEKLLNNLTTYLQKICPDAAMYSALMQGSLLQYSNEDLMVEYAQLFVGPFELKAPPYGSVYLDGERRVMGNSTMEVIKMYEEEGLSKGNESGDLPDHIAVELEFMSFLIYSEIKAMENSDFKSALESIGKQERFLDESLRRWIEPFCRDIKEGTDNGFYRALADCASTFLRSAYPGTIRESLDDQVLSAS